MGGKRVLIVGLSTRAFAESASRAGYTCLSVDGFGDLDQKACAANLALTRDLGRPYSAAAAVGVGQRLDADLASYVANLENHPAAVRRLAKGRRLLGNSPETLFHARDFAELGRVVQTAGGRVPLTLPHDQTRDLPPGRRWLRKPLRGGGGSGVVEFCADRPVRAGELVQERIDGVLASAAFAADGRRAVLLGLSQGLAGDPAFGARGHRYCGSLYPLPADAALLTRMEAIAQAATRAFGLVGVNGIDFVLREGEAFVLEINPRYSASMELLERNGGRSIFEIHAAACGGALPCFDPEPLRDVVGKAIVWAHRDIVVGDTRSWLSREDLRDIPFPGERIRRGHPMCTVFARGADRAACYSRFVAAAAAVQGEIEAEARGTHP